MFGLGLTSESVPGVSVTVDQCLQARCNVPGFTADQKLVCAANGYAGNLIGCLDPACVAYRALLNCGQPIQPNETTVIQPKYEGVINADSEPAGSYGSEDLTPQTYAAPAADGPTQTVEGSEVDSTGGVTVIDEYGDAREYGEPTGETPVTSSRLPSLWDLLDPTKASQFTYRGLHTTMPTWISQRWIDEVQQARRAAALPVESGFSWPGGGDLRPWLWTAAIVLILLSLSKGGRRGSRF